MTRNNKLQSGDVQDKKRIMIPRWLRMWAIVVVLVATGMSVWAFLFPNDKWSSALILSLLALGIGIPFFLFILPYISSGEVNLFGLGLKWLKEDIDTVQQRLLANQSVTVIDLSGQRWFWIDELGKAHPVPDPETAIFLSKGKGIIHVQASELDITIDAYPSVKDAQPKHNHNRDIFILYNKTLYYQSSLGFLFWLAAHKEIDFIKKESFNDWKDKNGKVWIEEITTKDFTDYKVV